MLESKLKIYVDEVMKFRRALNLTSVDDLELFYARFIAPTLRLKLLLPDQGRLLDVGSGMGVPGVPLLLALPGLMGVLVERRKKRAEFLRHLVRKLSLQAEVYDADVNRLPPLHVDVCVARAVTAESDLLKMFAPHCNPGAIAVLPVPSHAETVAQAGWETGRTVHLPAAIDGDAEQQIHCYHYGEPLQQSSVRGGGFT